MPAFPAPIKPILMKTPVWCRSLTESRRASASAKGNDTVAARLSEIYGWKVLDSYTTRPPRYEGEKGHIFSTKEEFDALPEKCAYTYFGGNEYCATAEQVNNSDIYIILFFH